MSEHKQLIVYLKEPKLGKVKTRLAKSIGEVKALALYKDLLQFTLKVCSRMPMDKNLSFAQESQMMYSGYSVTTQLGTDLGDRMKNSFNHFWARGKQKIVLIGSDCPLINTSILTEAFQKLEKDDLVLGSTEDGGYYLIGMSSLHPEIFQKISWSTTSVFYETMKRANELELKVSLLPTLYDIDIETDYERFVKEGFEKG